MRSQRISSYVCWVALDCWSGIEPRLESMVRLTAMAYYSRVLMICWTRVMDWSGRKEDLLRLLAHWTVVPYPGFFKAWGESWGHNGVGCWNLWRAAGR